MIKALFLIIIGLAALSFFHVNQYSVDSTTIKASISNMTASSTIASITNFVEEQVAKYGAELMSKIHITVDTK